MDSKEIKSAACHDAMKDNEPPKDEERLAFFSSRLFLFFFLSSRFVALQLRAKSLQR
jgi:hypothetical protein